MKHTLTTIFAILICTTLCFAQKIEKPNLNTLSFELGKTGLIYNLRFDHRLATRNLGFSFWAGYNFAKYLNATTFGGGSYYVIGKHSSSLELGLDIQYLVVDEFSDDQKGFSFIYPEYSVKTFYPNLNIGYRSYGQNTLFRIGFSPAVIKKELIPGGYISYGLTF